MDDYDVNSDNQTTDAGEQPTDAAEQRAPRRSRRATRPAMTPDRPSLDVLAELGISEPAEESVPTPEHPDESSAEPAQAEPEGITEENPAEQAEPEADEAGPERESAEAETEPGTDEAADEDEAAEDDDSMRLPATALLFQAPDLTPRRRRRASAPAGPPEVPGDEQDGEPAAAVSDDRPDAEGADEQADESAEGADSAESDDGGQPKRRRRRGGRGRRKTKKPGDEGAAETDDDADDDGAEDSTPSPKAAKKQRAQSEPEDGAGQTDAAAAEQSEDGGEGGGSRRRRRRRGRSARDEGAKARDEVTALKGSTRLEAKRQRRRDGRDANRRRAIITEAEFLARRESVDRAMVVRERDGRTQIAVLEDDVLVEHFVARKTQTSMVGNVYLGRVQNVLPSMEAAFVDLGRGRNAVLYAGEVNWDAAGLEGQPRRIEQALSSGDSVLVQVTKDPIGHKGARLTSQITLAGRYLVLVPSGAMTGISRKLPDIERNRLKKLLKEIVPEGQGVIVRTAAEGASEEELRRDVERLTKTWADIDKKVKKSSTTAPVLLKGEPELSTRVVRDVFNEDFRSLTVQGDEAWKTISEYVGSVAPDLVERLHHWTAAEDVFASHRIDEQLAKGMDRKVWLPSGGSLVIDRTEAMTVVDVNTGKFTGSGGTLEETVTRNNLEAAEEIVRQLRLRDIGGIIVVDFIDMVLESNRDLVLRRLVECLGRDRTRHQVAEVTSLGLVQMTRKRVGQGLVEAFSTTCEHCHGRGYVLHDDPVESGQSEDDGDEGGRSGRGGRGGRSRGGRGQSGGGQQQPASPPVESVGDPAQRAQVRATLAAIAAAAAHAHEEHHLDSEPRPDGAVAPVSEDSLETVVELSTEGVLSERHEIGDDVDLAAGEPVDEPQPGAEVDQELAAPAANGETETEAVADSAQPAEASGQEQLQD